MEILVFFGYTLVNIFIYILSAIMAGFGIAAGFEGWKAFRGWQKNRSYLRDMEKKDLDVEEGAAGAVAM